MNWSHTQIRSGSRRPSGFTLIELMVTLAVVAITLAIGVPSFHGMMSDNRMTGTANNLIGALNVARSEAIKRGRSISVTAATSGSVTGWDLGGTITLDPLAITDANTIKSFGATTGMSFSGGSTTYTFLPSGLLSIAAAQEITICDLNRSGETGRKISISLSGRLAVSNATCS